MTSPLSPSFSLSRSLSLSLIQLSSRKANCSESTGKQIILPPFRFKCNRTSSCQLARARCIQIVVCTCAHIRTQSVHAYQNVYYKVQHTYPSLGKEQERENQGHIPSRAKAMRHTVAATYSYSECIQLAYKMDAIANECLLLLLAAILQLEKDSIQFGSYSLSLS